MSRNMRFIIYRETLEECMKEYYDTLIAIADSPAIKILSFKFYDEIGRGLIVNCHIEIIFCYGDVDNLLYPIRQYLEKQPGDFYFDAGESHDGNWLFSILGGWRYAETRDFIVSCIEIDSLGDMIKMRLARD